MKKLKRILTLLLCAAMVLSLAACGGNNNGTANGEPGDNPAPGGGNSSASGTGGKPGSGSDSGSQTPAQDTYVYVPEYVKIQNETNGSPNRLIYHDGKFLTDFYMVIGNNTPEGVTPEYEGQYDIYGDRFYWLNLDGSMEELTAYEPLPTPELPEGAQDGYSSSYVYNYQVAPDGSIVVLEQTYSWYYDGPDDIPMYSDEWYAQEYYNYQVSEEHYYLRFLNPDGSEKSCVPLDSLKQDSDYFYVNGFAVGKDGCIYLPSDMNMYILDNAGTLAKTLTAENWFDMMVSLPDGRVAVSMWLEDGQKLVPISETYELDYENAYTMGNGMYGIYNASPAANGEYDFVYTNGSNLMGMKLADGSVTKILNWINSDVDPIEVSGNAYMLEDGRILTMETKWDDDYTKSESSFVFLKKVPASSVEQKTIITLATQYLDYRMQSRIVKFNRSNPTYRIELRDYSEYNTEEDYQGGITKLTAELLAGNMPDILDLNGMPVGQLESKGILADLYPMLNADSELSGQILPGILKALDKNGKIYHIPSTFQLFTVLGAASVVGDTPGWTLKDYQLALSNMPDGCEPFSQWMTRGNMLSYLLNMNWNTLVDWETGKCAFDTGLFADILKFAAEFPAEYVWDEDDVWTEEDDETYRVSTGRQMLMMTWLYDFRDWQYYDAMFGGDSTCIGFPVSEGVGNAFQFDEAGYAITTGCKYADAAWQFIRESLTEKYQAEYGWQFPTNKAAFQKRLEAQMTPNYMRDENGNFVLDENGEKIEIFDEWGWTGGTIKMGALTQEQADEILEVINSTTRVTDYNYDDELYNTIVTDCEAFFAGQKSAEEVCKLLQSKLTIYVNERR